MQKKKLPENHYKTNLFAILQHPENDGFLETFKTIGKTTFFAHVEKNKHNVWE